MFLFLSKLLPSFLYPLGLVCVLLLIALVLVWRHPRATAGLIVAALGVLLLGSNGWVQNWLVQSLEWQNIPQNLPQAEAIVILGGATRSAAFPRPTVDLAEEGDRVFYGAQLYKQGLAPLIIASGGRIDWKGKGDPESADIAKILQGLGVPESAIVQDPNSFNTYENAVNVQKILKERKIQQILLVTSAMHMPRSLAIFKRLGIPAIPAPTDFQMTQLELEEPGSSWQAASLNIVPDSDRLRLITRALKEYIGIVVYWLKGWL